jgi:hypothetical protein
MKKFLFTLASLVAFGFAANAGDPVMGFSEYEITLGAGEEMEIAMSIQDLGGDAIKGFQTNFEMQNPAGERITSGCHLGYLEKYGNSEKFAWFGGVGYTLTNGNTVSQSNGQTHQTDAWDSEGDYMPGNPYGVEAHVVYTGKYNLILTNAQTGTCYPSRGQVYPQDIIVFTVQVDEGWEDEYAVFKMVKGDFSTTAGTKHCEFIELKINNKDYAVAPQDLQGVIDFNGPSEDGIVTFFYSGDEVVNLTVNGEAYNGEDIQLVDGDNVFTVVAEAEGYNPMEKNFTINWTAPVVPQELTGEIHVSEPTEDGVVTVSYDGPEDVTVAVTVNGEPVEGEIVLAEGDNEIVVTVTADGYEPMEETFNVTYTAPVPPVVYTDVPTVKFDITDDAYIFTAEGNGEVKLYVNDVEVENPYTVDRPEAGEEPIEVFVYATAQEAGKEMSTSDVQRFEIEPKEGGETPEDPHMTGYWLVLIDAQGNPVWYPLIEGTNGDYTTTVSLDYETYGYVYYDATTEPERHPVDFYYVVNGVRYGAPEAEVATVLGTALSNLLVEGDGFYTLPVGYNYNLGIAFSTDREEMYVYAAQAGFVGVDELNANKTVAGVRYFNLAGQEMQEANGMTIVVTTYTDGTTSAVKVMK